MEFWADQGPPKLKLAFSGHLTYDRKSGFRTPEISLPFRALGGFRDGFRGVIEEMARPKRFELLTPRFVVWCSIQLSYGRAGGGVLPGGAAGFKRQTRHAGGGAIEACAGALASRFREGGAAVWIAPSDPAGRRS